MNLDGKVYNPDFIIKAEILDEKKEVLRLTLKDHPTVDIVFEDIKDDKDKITTSGILRCNNALDAINVEMDVKNSAAKRMCNALSVFDTIYKLLDTGKALGVVPK